MYKTREQFIKFVLNDVTFRYIDKIFTLEEAYCLLEMIRNEEGDNEIYDITNFDIADFRYIFIKILEKGGSMKDLTYVFERIIHYSKSSNDKDFIAFSVYQDIIFNKKR